MGIRMQGQRRPPRPVIAKTSDQSNSSERTAALAQDAALGGEEGILRSREAACVWDLMTAQNTPDTSWQQLPDAVSVDKLLEMDAARLDC